MLVLLSSVAKYKTRAIHDEKLTELPVTKFPNNTTCTRVYTLGKNNRTNKTIDVAAHLYNGYF